MRFIVLLLVIASPIVGAKPADPVGPVKPVEVVNGENAPVIVEGQVQVDGSVVIQNNESSPVPVSIQPMSTVEPFVLRVSERDSNMTGSQTIFTNSSYRVCIGAVPICESQQTEYRVPIDKRLVITNVSFRARTLFASPLPERAAATLELSGPGGYGFSLPIGLLDELNPPLHIWGKSQPLNLAVAPDTRVMARITWSNFFDGDAEASMTVSGQLISVP